MEMTLQDIAELVGGSVEGDGEVLITGVNGIEDAQPGDLSFVRAPRYLALLEASNASAVLISEAPEACQIPLILVPQPDLAFAMVLQRFDLEQKKHPQGIHPTAVVEEGAVLGEGVGLGAHVHVALGAVIGAGTVLYPGVYVGRGSTLGQDCVVYPNTVIREETEIGARCILHAGVVLGSDGFGFAPLDGQWAKIPQVGRVILGDDVEVGSNSTIDRATFGVTRIGRGTKIDNLVQIGHNVRIGEHCAIAGMAGIAGSAVLGDHVRVGASAGVVGHIDVGDGAVIGGRAGVTKSVPPGKVVSGFPAIDHNLERRVLVAQQKAPELLRRVRNLERQVQALEKALHE